MILEGPTVAATIFDVDREVHYPARLVHIPRAGELVKFFSYLDSASGHEMHDATGFYFEVVQVRHDLADLVENNERSQMAKQSVTIFVRRSYDPMLR